MFARKLNGARHVARMRNGYWPFITTTCLHIYIKTRKKGRQKKRNFRCFWNNVDTPSAEQRRVGKLEGAPARVVTFNIVGCYGGVVVEVLLMWYL